MLCSWLRLGFSIVKLSSKELESELRMYRPWSLPRGQYQHLVFDRASGPICSEIVAKRSQLELHTSLVNKLGLHFSSRNVSHISQNELMVLANVEFKEGGSPLSRTNIDNILNTKVFLKEVGLVTKLLFCLKVESKQTMLSKVMEEMNIANPEDLEQNLIPALLLLQKCLSCPELENPTLLIPTAFIEKCMLIEGRVRTMAEAVMVSLRMQVSSDKANAYRLIEEENHELQLIFSIYHLKDQLQLSSLQLNRLLDSFLRRLTETTSENSWMIINIFDRLSHHERLIVCNRIPIHRLHHLDYVVFLELLERSDVEIQVKAKHQLPYSIKHRVDGDTFHRILNLRFEMVYDVEFDLTSIIIHTLTPNLSCFKGILHFLSDFYLDGDACLKVVSKIALDIIKTPKLDEYDPVEYYNTVALLAKYQLCRSGFWRGIQDYLMIQLDEAIELSNYLSSEEREVFVSNLVLLLKNHYGKSSMEDMIITQIKLSLQHLWTIEGLNSLCTNLEWVGIGENEIWMLVQENLEMLRRDAYISSQVMSIWKLMLRMNKGAGHFWRRVGEASPPKFVDELKAESLLQHKSTILNYLMEGSSRRQEAL